MPRHISCRIRNGLFEEPYLVVLRLCSLDQLSKADHHPQRLQFAHQSNADEDASQAAAARSVECPLARGAERTFLDGKWGLHSQSAKRLRFYIIILCDTTSTRKSQQ